MAMAPAPVTAQASVVAWPTSTTVGVAVKELITGSAGGCVTVTLTGTDVAVSPALLRATAVRTCVPSGSGVVSSAAWYGAAVSSVPSAAPSNWNCTPATATASEALATMVTTPVRLAPLAGEVMDTVGGFGALVTVTCTGAEVAKTPAVLRAAAVSACAPLGSAVVSSARLNGAAVTSAPLFAPSTWNCTPATPSASDAEAETVTVPETVAPSTGVEMETVGGVGGGGAPPPPPPAPTSTMLTFATAVTTSPARVICCAPGTSALKGAGSATLRPITHNVPGLKGTGAVNAWPLIR